MNTPDDLHYSADHEWVGVEPDGQVRVGITDYAQDHLGEVVFVELPEVGESITGGSMSARSSRPSPSRTSMRRSRGRSSTSTAISSTPPNVINEDPYGDGWMFVIAIDDGADNASLLDAEAYRALTEG